MSVAVRRSSFSPFESIFMPNIERETLQTSPTKWRPLAEQYTPVETPVEAKKDDDRPGQLDIWSSIQSQKAKEVASPTATPAPYVHPLVRRSSSLMSQKSLEICTESLGSETGSTDFSSFLDDCHSSKSEAEEEEHDGPICNTLMAEEEVPRFRVAKAVEERRVQSERKELVEVNYHCSISRRSPPRSFPPPLPSISRRDGPCIHMRPHRRDGRLVVEAVPVRSQNYLHAQRQGGRLLLCFIDATFNGPDDTETHPSDTLEMTQLQVDKHVFEPNKAKEEEEEEKAISILALTEEGELEEEKNYDEEGEEETEEEEEEEEEEVEEEVEVVDRGTVVEVKVSTQPQQQSGVMKVQRSSFVINKFVGAGETRWAEKLAECKPTAPNKQEIQQDHRNTATASPTRRSAPTTTTAAAAAAAASTFSTSSEGYYSYYHSFDGRRAQLGGGYQPPADENILLFTSKPRNREELLHNMWRCSQLWRPLFILEPCCIATSS